MVTKNRLQELIDKKATIYELCNEEVFEIDFSKLIPNQFYDDGFNIYLGDYKVFFEYKNLYEFESKEQAEWVEKMHAERTEKFEPPTWEEFEKSSKFNFWVNKFDGLGGLYCIEKTTDIMFDEYGNEFEKEYIDISATLIENHKTGSGYFYRRDYTKENYMKACEYARNLFLGKENDNETDSDR